MIPARYVTTDQTRKQHGHRVDRLAPYFTRGDPLADDLVGALSRLPAGRTWRMLNTALDHGIAAVPDPPAELAALFEHVDAVPMWVHWDELNLGGATVLRSGIFGYVALVCCSLPFAYSSPAGNKPLTFSGELLERAPRRLHETGRFILETCRADGLRRFSEGFKITVKVRLMHAQVRRLLLGSGRWDAEAWGLPINQADMAAMTLVLSALVLDALRRLGFHFTAAEAQAVIQLWRYSGYLLGIEPELLCANEAEASRLIDLIERTQQPADEDSRLLSRVLLEAPLYGPAVQRLSPSVLLYAFSRALLGDRRADALGYPRHIWARFATQVPRLLVPPVELVRRAVPGCQDLAVASGLKLLSAALDSGLGDRKVEFQPPSELRPASPAREPAAPPRGER